MDFHRLAMNVYGMSQTQGSGCVACSEEQSIACACLQPPRMQMHALRQLLATEAETEPRNCLVERPKQLKHETLNKEMGDWYPSDVLESRCV